MLRIRIHLFLCPLSNTLGQGLGNGGPRPKPRACFVKKKKKEEEEREKTKNFIGTPLCLDVYILCTAVSLDQI